MREWNDIIAELETAANEFDRLLVGKLTDELIEWLRSDQPVNSALGENEWIRPLNILKGRRYFDLLVRLAEALRQTGYSTLKSRRIFAQALIELGLLTTAIDVLERLSVDCLEAANDSEYSEARGLLGRAYKQTFVELTNSQPANPTFQHNLILAIQEYHAIYQSDPEKHYWHGINVVALLKWAERNGVTISAEFGTPDALASNTLKSLFPDGFYESNPEADPWQCATAAEACIALGDYETALKFVLAYTADKLREKFNIDAFEYASTLRQLEEIWQFSPDDDHQSRILHLLRSVLLGQEGGQVNLTSLGRELKSVNELSEDMNFEAVLGTERFKSFRWYRKGLQRAASVVKVSNRMDECFGTGFVIKASLISEKIASQWVLVTNAHVMSEEEAERNPVNSTTKALHPSQVIVTFEARDDPSEYTIEEVLFSSGRGKLDCTIATFTGNPDFQDELPITKIHPIFDNDSRVYIIGHPKGGGLSFSLHDNKVLGHQDHLLHYRAPTEGGSSGSPVFTDDWDLFAVHHAGGGHIPKLDGSDETYAANEGIAFRAILDAARDVIEGE
ncbi:trypsin-like peptidase domain-containing protein [Verrucomicrobiaceae bacterium 5K15]|uniref:Serine protease n=1 Tax=Oceaniferula flava TaxID=2800421 RepID=A0AAE2SBX7_9BACT|nr:serine protease [Oceaniferula flavus]MBK1855633.1 trypsin-like peptidase domain-containing protein [Oceaniferula flavus]MBM1136939.1 trypsin-like peptidase domain-containing protein [Oceaniferula flavus]